MKVLAFGEILWDVIEGEEHLGGAPFNFAVHSAQCGNEAFIISRLGSDLRGNRAFALSQAHRVDVSFIQWDQTHATGVVDVTLNNGQPDYIIRPDAAYDYIQQKDILKMLNKKQFDVFYFGSLAQRNHISAEALYGILAEKKFSHVFYDVNLRKSGYNEDIIKRSLTVASILKLNSDEVPVISDILTSSSLSHEAFCQCVKKRYPNIGTIIITASERGCSIFEHELVHIPGTPVVVRDAIGAGDAFSASFIHVYVTSGDALTAAKIANQVGAFVATRAGAIPDYAPEIKRLLSLEVKEW